VRANLETSHALWIAHLLRKMLAERWSEATRKAMRGRIEELKDDIDAK